MVPKSVSIVDFYSAVGSAKRTQKLEFALQSFAKRSKYSEFYYHKFLESTSSGNLAFERIDSSGNLRINFESYATAFVANAHALIDSFPFVVFLSLQPLCYIHPKQNKLTKISPGSSNWNDDFYASLLYSYPREKRFALLFKSLMNADDFLLLRKISNNHKHKFLSRIINDTKFLKYEIIDFDTGKVTHVNMSRLFLRLHNSLLPRLFILYNELAKAAGKAL